MKKIFFLTVIFIVSLFSLCFKVNAQENLASNSKSAILVEAQTGDILFSKNINEKRGIASMTKIMTISIVYDAIENNDIEFDTQLTCSSHAKSMGGTQVYLEEGETHKVSDLIKCVLLASANDAAVCLAEGIAGSEELFVKKMNEKAKELQMNDTHYSDATGLSTENHYSSAYDMSIISRYLVNNYPEILEITSLHDSYFRENSDNPFWLVNTNKLAGKNGIDGLKTGWNNYSKYCITLTKETSDMRLIAVCMGYDNPIIRNQEASELLNYGSTFFKKMIFVNKDEVVKKYSTILYENDSIKLYPNKAIIKTVLKNEAEKYEVKYEFTSDKKGRVILCYNGKKIDETYLDTKDCKKKNLLKLFFDVLGLIF